MSEFVSRGFTGRADRGGDRLPPGQYEERGFPVLTAGPTPDIDPADWGFRIDGMVAEEAEWTWDEFHELEFEEIPCDIHCVTSWSKLGTSFRGVSVDLLLDRAEPLGAYAMAFSSGATPQTWRSRTSPTGRPGSSPSTMASRSSARMAGRLGCWSRTCTSGRARSGSPG